MKHSDTALHVLKAVVDAFSFMKRRLRRQDNSVRVEDNLRASTLEINFAMEWIRLMGLLKEICPRGNNKVVIYISLYHDKCLLFMLEMY